MKFKANLLVYFAASVFFFLFWIYWVFPYDALQSRIITEIENRSQGQYKIDAKKMDLSIFGSLTFIDLKVTQPGNGEQLLIKTPKLKLGFSPISLISGNPDFSFYLKGSKGSLDGNFKQNSDEVSFRLNFDQYPLSDIQFLVRKLKVGINGSLDGLVQARINKGDPGRDDGEINLQLQNFTMDSTKISLDPSSPDAEIQIPAIKISGGSDSVIKGEINKEDLNISSIALKGGDIDLNLDGKVTLHGAEPQDYRLALQGSFKLSENLTKGLQQFLFILDQQKTPEGVYPLAITGRLGKPSIRIGKFNLPI